jgi:hypothetical protein
MTRLEHPGCVIATSEIAMSGLFVFLAAQGLLAQNGFDGNAMDSTHHTPLGLDTHGTYDNHMAILLVDGVLGRCLCFAGAEHGKVQGKVATSQHIRQTLLVHFLRIEQHNRLKGWIVILSVILYFNFHFVRKMSFTRKSLTQKILS